MSSFELWDGNYDKKHYDVMLPDGTIIKHCWPNAGKMCPMRNGLPSYTPEDNIKVKLSATHPLDDILEGS